MPDSPTSWAIFKKWLCQDTTRSAGIGKVGKRLDLPRHCSSDGRASQSGATLLTCVRITLRWWEKIVEKNYYPNPAIRGQTIADISARIWRKSLDLRVEHPAHDLTLERFLPEGPLRRRPEQVDGDTGQRVFESVLDRQNSLDRDDRVVELHVLGVPAHLARLLEPGLVQLVQLRLLILETWVVTVPQDQSI